METEEKRIIVDETWLEKAGIDAVLRIRNVDGFFDSKGQRLRMMLRMVKECEVRVTYLVDEPEVIIALENPRKSSEYTPSEMRQLYQSFNREVIRVGLLIEKLVRMIDAQTDVEVDYLSKNELLGKRLWRYYDYLESFVDEDLEDRSTCFMPEELEMKVDAFLNLVFPPQNYLLGMCHDIWYLKKCILRYGFGLLWKTPSERNPHILFD